MQELKIRETIIGALSFIKLTRVEWLQAVITHEAILMIFVRGGCDMGAEYVLLAHSAFTVHYAKSERVHFCIWIKYYL
jgi:hypothetical protein